jgi:predicted transcriptional regulator
VTICGESESPALKTGASAGRTRSRPRAENVASGLIVHEATEVVAEGVRIDADTKERLEALAERARRSKSFPAAEAIAAFIEAESWQLDEMQAGSRSSMRAAAWRTSA